jgi:hypothetical protein
MRRTSRRRFLAGAVGTGTIAVGAPWVQVANASDDELAYANFGVSGELLLADFYARAIAAGVFGSPATTVLRRGRSAATQHAKALGDLLVGAGETAPAPEDFEFAWPDGTFASAAAATKAGGTVLRALLGSYQSAIATVSEPVYRILYASLAAGVGQQLGALLGRAGVEPFPVATDLETASAALEGYLG